MHLYIIWTHWTHITLQFPFDFDWSIFCWRVDVKSVNKNNNYSILIFFSFVRSVICVFNLLSISLVFSIEICSRNSIAFHLSIQRSISFSYYLSFVEIWEWKGEREKVYWQTSIQIINIGNYSVGPKSNEKQHNWNRQ